jgi:hypothetical protein
MYSLSSSLANGGILRCVGWGGKKGGGHVSIYFFEEQSLLGVWSRRLVTSLENRSAWKTDRLLRDLFHEEELTMRVNNDRG